MRTGMAMSAPVQGNWINDVEREMTARADSFRVETDIKDARNCAKPLHVKLQKTYLPTQPNVFDE